MTAHAADIGHGDGYGVEYELHVRGDEWVVIHYVSVSILISILSMNDSTDIVYFSPFLFRL